MKKLAFSLIACLAIVQSTHAATSALTESLLEYEAITTAIGSPNFQIIDVSEFIIDIQRITRKIDTIGQVKYKIVTREPRVSSSDLNTLAEAEYNENFAVSGHRDRCHQDRTHTYIAILNVAPNPGIGPNIITVVSITPTSHTDSFFENEHHHEVEVQN